MVTVLPSWCFFFKFRPHWCNRFIGKSILHLQTGNVGLTGKYCKQKIEKAESRKSLARGNLSFEACDNVETWMVVCLHGHITHTVIHQQKVHPNPLSGRMKGARPQTLTFMHPLQITLKYRLRFYAPALQPYTQNQSVYSLSTHTWAYKQLLLNKPNTHTILN